MQAMAALGMRPSVLSLNANSHASEERNYEMVAAETLSRPRTRGDCIGGPRPRPWLGCRHHLGLVRVLKTGNSDCKSGRLNSWQRRAILMQRSRSEPRRILPNCSVCRARPCTSRQPPHSRSFERLWMRAGWYSSYVGPTPLRSDARAQVVGWDIVGDSLTKSAAWRRSYVHACALEGEGATLGILAQQGGRVRYP